MWGLEGGTTLGTGTQPVLFWRGKQDRQEVKG